MRSTCRSRSGSYLVETAATVAFAVPLSIYVIFVAIEACQVYGITQGLQQAARESARALASLYAVDPGIAGNKTDQATYGFKPVIDSKTLTGVVANTNQFVANFDNSTSPASVTVTVTYASGQFGLATFPQTDPLFLGPNYHLQATATYTLE